MKCFTLILLAFLLTGTQSGSAQIETQKKNKQMDAQTLISILSFSKTLIQDAEIKLIWYEHYPTPPEDIGKFVQKGIEYSKQEYRDAPQKTSNPEALRKEILKDIESYKTYGPFHDSDEFFLFQEVNLVFQRIPVSAGQPPQCNFQAEKISRFDNFPSANDAPFPSVDFARYYNGGQQEYRVVNSDQRLDSTLPHQIHNGRINGSRRVDSLKKEDSLLSRFPIRLPPVNIDKAEVQIEPAEVDREAIFIITYPSFEKVLTKTYVRIADIPQIFREEHYYKSESPNANEDGYWLRLVEEYRDFVYFQTLGIAHPKIFEAREYRADGFMRRSTSITIIEMEFNQGLPANFFDWNIQEYLIDSKEGEIQ